MNKKLLAAFVFAGMMTITSFGMKPVTIVDQGSFMVAT